MAPSELESFSLCTLSFGRGLTSQENAGVPGFSSSWWCAERREHQQALQTSFWLCLCHYNGSESADRRKGAGGKVPLHLLSHVRDQHGDHFYR